MGEPRAGASAGSWEPCSASRRAGARTSAPANTTSSARWSKRRLSAASRPLEACSVPRRGGSCASSITTSTRPTPTWRPSASTAWSRTPSGGRSRSPSCLTNSGGWSLRWSGWIPSRPGPRSPGVPPSGACRRSRLRSMADRDVVARPAAGGSVRRRPRPIARVLGRRLSDVVRPEPLARRARQRPRCCPRGWARARRCQGSNREARDQAAAQGLHPGGARTRRHRHPNRRDRRRALLGRRPPRGGRAAAGGRTWARRCTSTRSAARLVSRRGPVIRVENYGRSGRLLRRHDEQA